MTSITPAAIVTIDPRPALGVVRSPAAGHVAGIADRNLTLLCRGRRVEASIGFGPERRGRLIVVHTPQEVARDYVAAFAEGFSLTSASAALEAGCAGVIGGALPIKDVERMAGPVTMASTGSEALPAPLLLLDGFGLAAGTGDRLDQLAGCEVRVSALTRVGAGARRPFIAQYCP